MCTIFQNPLDKYIPLWYNNKCQGARGKPNRHTGQREQIRKPTRGPKTVTRLWGGTDSNACENSCKYFHKPLDKYIPLCYNKVNQKKESESNEYLLYA